jgi:hypothetical protein
MEFQTAVDMVLRGSVSRDIETYSADPVIHVKAGREKFREAGHGLEGQSK